MKIANTNDYEVDSGGQQGKSGKATISTTNAGAFFEMMSSSIYSDSFGSIVRELTSNCYDAHIEFGVDRAVVVGYEWGENCLFMTFEDFGIGISPDRFENVYMNYLESTKNDTNEEIGGFGIGGKSPLSYTEIYYLRTRHEGIEYYYSISKGLDGIPDWDLLYSKPTALRNGTLVKFIIEGSYASADYYKFEEAIKFQLRYFDGVYIKGFNVDNDYTIYQFDTFKYRGYVDETTMHLIVGKVTYPINWKFLKRPEIKIPVGVKFDIGEIMVTPNREQVRYNDEMVEIINRKIDACLVELQSLARYEFEELDDYLKWKDGTVKKIRTEKCTIPMYEGNYGKHRNGKDKKYPFKVDFVYFKPLGKVPIVIPEDPFFFLQEVGRINGGSYSSRKENASEPNLFKFMKTITPYRTKEFKSNRMKNQYIQSGLIISKRKIKLKSFLKEIGLAPEGISPFHKRMKITPVITEEYNKLKLVQLYRKVMTAEFVKRSQHYDNLVIPKDFIDSYQEERRAKRPTKIAGEIAVLDFRLNGNSKVIRQFTDFDKQLIIYGANKDKDYLKAIYMMMYPRQSKITVIAINQNEFKLMEQPNMVSLEQLITGTDRESLNKSRVLREQLTAFYIYKRYNDLDLAFTNHYIPSVLEHFTKLHQFVDKCTKGEYIPTLLKSKFIQELLESAEEGNLLIKEWVDLTDKLERIQQDLMVIKPIMENSNLSANQKADIAKLLVIKGYSPDRMLFFVPNEIERSWITEWEEYSRYLRMINDMWDRVPYAIKRLNNFKPKLTWQQTSFQILDSNRSVKTSMLQLS